jgi:D-aminoacyl-tRNA deacylase
MDPRPPLIVASSADPASLNIAQSIIQKQSLVKQEPSGPWETYQGDMGKFQLVIVEKELIYTQSLDLPKNLGPVIFVSKHRSNTNTPALTVHATGNLTSEALYGGRPEEVSKVEPFRIQVALSEISREVARLNLDIEVTLEATHHGPTNLPVPICFVEIGSGPQQWQDPILGQIVAEATIAATAPDAGEIPNAVGFGGTHYPMRHTKLLLQGTYGIGHIVSRYALETGVSDTVIRSTFEKTQGGCKTAVLDWKGLKSEQRGRLQDILPTWGVEPIRA